MLILLAAMASASVAGSGKVTECLPQQVALSLDGRDGEYAGMSQDGALLSFRNTGRSACRMRDMPRVTFYDRNGRSLPLRRRISAPPTGNGIPAPVVIPAGGVATSILHWVSGPVFPRSRCVVGLSVGVFVGGKVLKTKGGGRFCAAAGTLPTFDQPALSAATG